MIRNIDDFNIERKYGSAGWGGAPVLRYHSSLRAADLLFYIYPLMGSRGLQNCVGDKFDGISVPEIGRLF